MSAPLAAAEHETLSIAFGNDQVSVSGASRNHEVILFGIGIGQHGRASLLTREAQALADDDGDGRVEFAVRHLPQRSVWVAVDLEDGAYTIRTPDGAPPRTLVLPVNAWRSNREHVDVSRPWLEVLLVRRRVGAWTLRMADGGANDADQRHDGVAHLRLDRMERLAGEDTKGPRFAVPKDLMVMVDPHTLECFVSEAE